MLSSLFLGAACGIVSLPFGVAQAAILPGAFHWVVELAHLALGVIYDLGSRQPAPRPPCLTRESRRVCPSYGR